MIWAACFTVASTRLLRLHRVSTMILRALIQQRLGLGHSLDGLFHFGIGLDGDASLSSRLKAVMYISRLQQALDPIAILGEFGFA